MDIYSGHIFKKMIPKQRMKNQYYVSNQINHNIEIPSFQYEFQEVRTGLKNQPEKQIAYLVTLNF